MELGISVSKKIYQNKGSLTMTEQKMFELAKQFVEQRYPAGWGGVAVMHTACGQYLTSVEMKTIDSNVAVCLETGALCEASKFKALRCFKWVS